MSYDIYIKKLNGTPYPFDNHLKGGTYAVNGSDEAWYNITYNYGQFYRIGYKGFENGLSDLDGKRVEETLPYLRTLLDILHGNPSDDYWEPSEGNARMAIVNLLFMAEMCRDGVWLVC